MSFPKNTPTATLQLDKPRTIALTLDALNRLEELLGEPIMQIRLDSAQVIKRLDAWVWASLDEKDRKEVTLAEVSKMIHLGNLAQIMGEVSGLIAASLPDPLAGKTDPAPQMEMVEAGRS